MFWQGMGSFAEECLVDAGSAFAAPPGLTDAEAAGFWIPHLTGWIGLVDRGRVAAGDWLAVLGASGGSGIAAVQLGRALGARVIAVAGGEEKVAFCRSLGADVALDHRTCGPLADALRDATDGHGVDLVYDPVGGAMAEDAAKAMARHGRLLAVGFASGVVADDPGPGARRHEHLAWSACSPAGTPAPSSTPCTRTWPRSSPTGGCATRSPARSRGRPCRARSRPWPTAP